MLNPRRLFRITPFNVPEKVMFSLSNLFDFQSLVLLGKPEGRNHWGDLGVDNIKMDLQEVGCGYMDWIGLAHDRESWRTLVSAVMKLGVP